MACSDCNAARITTGHWPYHDPRCLWCGARLIQRIGKLGNTDAEITQRRRVVLADWMAQGHDEQELREMAKRKDMALEPVTKSASPSPSAPSARSIPESTGGQGRGG